MATSTDQHFVIGERAMKKFLCVLAVVVSTACSSGLAPLQQQQQQQQVVIVQVPSAPVTPVNPTQTMVNVALYLRADTCTGEEIASANVVANGGNYVTGSNGRTSSFSVVSGSVVNWSASRAGYNSRSGSFNAGNGGDFSIFLSRECGTGPVSPPPTTPPPPTTFTSTQSATGVATAYCPAGTTGASVTRTSTASGFGSSTVSQAEADAKARTDAQQNADRLALNAATAALVCIPIVNIFTSTQSATGVATAYCPAGTTGASVTRTSTASGFGSSTVSQAEADAKARTDAQQNADRLALNAATAALVCTVPPTCDFGVNLDSGQLNYTYQGGNNGTIVQATAGCTWTVTSSDARVVITSGSSGKGGGSFSFLVAGTSDTATLKVTLTFQGQGGFVKSWTITRTGHP